MRRLEEADTNGAARRSGSESDIVTTFGSGDPWAPFEDQAVCAPWRSSCMLP
jgi:hypothetical protein